MFGRRAKRANQERAAQEAPLPPGGSTLTVDVSPMGAPSSVDHDTHAVSPIRAADSGQDSGLEAIEAEFTISDADLGLLDLSAMAFDEQASRLSLSEVILAEHRDELAGFLRRLNSVLSDRLETPIDLQPYYMIPERCWEGEHQQVLVEVLDLAPDQTWNILPLAADAATASAVGVVEHPGARALNNRDVAGTLIEEALEKMHRTFERATFAADTVDTAALDAARSQAATDIRAIARRMAGVLVGADAVDHARATFFND